MEPAIDISDSFSEDSFDIDEEEEEQFGGKLPSASKIVPHKEGLVVMKEMPPACPKKKEDDETVSTDSDDSDDDETASDTASETSTIEALSRDPLFLVLSHYLSNDKGNIVDALYKINKTLKQLVKQLKK